MNTMNRNLCEENASGYFVTMFVGVLNLDTGHLDYCNAGHEAPFVIGGESLPIDVKPNLPLGALPEWDYEGQEMQLSLGDMLFLYTDGLSEAKNTEKQSLGRNRVNAKVLVISSCASKKDLVNCQNENRELTNNYLTAKEQLAGSQARITSLEEQLASQKSLLEEQKRAYTRLQRTLDKSVANASQNNISIDKLVDQINESNQYIRHLVEVKSKSDSLNMVLTNNLTRSLSKEELKEVDVQVLKGVVYISLADNMLYRSGSYEINDRAEETLSKIAKIIMDYKDYDVLIEGNTDNVPISRENISVPSL